MATKGKGKLRPESLPRTRSGSPSVERQPTTPRSGTPSRERSVGAQQDRSQSPTSAKSRKSLVAPKSISEIHSYCSTVHVPLDPTEAVEVARQRISSDHGAKALIGILGSEDGISEETTHILRALADACVELGSKVAFFTSGAGGVQQKFTEFCGGQQCYELLPTGEKKKYQTGTLITSGASVSERDCIFTMLGQAYILVEGGPKAAKLAMAAHHHGGIIIPLGRTGGASIGMEGFEAEKPDIVRAERWMKLWDEDMHVKEYAQNVADMLNNVHLRRKQKDGANKLYASFLQRHVDRDVKRHVEQEPVCKNHLETWTAKFYEERLVKGRRFGGENYALHKDCAGYRHRPQKPKIDNMLQDAGEVAQREKAKAITVFARNVQHTEAASMPHEMKLDAIENELTRLDARRLMLLSELRGRGAAHKVDAIFDMLDTSHDGMIDKREFAEMLRNLEDPRGMKMQPDASMNVERVMT